MVRVDGNCGACIMNRLIANLFPTANWITYFRILWWPPMVYCFATGQYLAGGICFGIGMVLDILDGKVSRWQGGVLSPGEEATLTWWQIMNFKGVTNHGMFVDPLLDKIVNGTAMLMLAKFVWWPLAIAPVIVDLFLQFGVRRIKQKYGIGNGAANVWGKAKTWGQSLAVAAILVWKIWFPAYTLGEDIGNGMLLGAGWLGVMSVYRHLRPLPAAAKPVATT